MTEHTDGRTIKRIGAIGIILCAGIWIAWLRQPALTTPLWSVDEGITAAIADEILAGGIPFRDATDLRAPLTYYLYAAVFAVAGPNNMDAIHMAHTGLVIATALLVLGLGWKLGGWATGGWALWIYCGLACCLFGPLDNLALHTEWPLAFCSAAGAWLYLIGRHRERKRWLFGSGILFGLAVLSKQPAALDLLAPLALEIGLLFITPTAIRQTVRNLLCLGAGFLLPLALTAFYFAAHGALSDLVFYTWTYNTRYYVPEVPLADRLPTVLVPLKLLHAYRPSLLIIVCVSLLTILWRGVSHKSERTKSNVLNSLYAPLWFLASLAATTLSGRGFEHYSIQILAPASLVASQLLGRMTTWMLLHVRRHDKRLAPAVLTAASLTTLVLAQVNFCLQYRAKIAPHVDPSVAMATLVSELTTREDRIFVWGFYADFHPLSNRLPASRFVHSAFLTGLIPWTNLGRDTSYAIVPGSMETLIADLEKSRPRLIIDTSRSLNRQFTDYPPHKFPAFQAYLNQHYIEYEPQRSKPAGWFRFYLRRDATPLLTPQEEAPHSAPPPSGNALNINEDFSPFPQIALHGSDPQGQLQQLGLLVGNNDNLTITFPPASERLIVVPLSRQTWDTSASAIRIVSHTTDGRQSISEPLSFSYQTPPVGLSLKTTDAEVPANKLSSIHKPQRTQQDGQEVWLCHAYTALSFPLPLSAKQLHLGYGILSGAYSTPHESTDGVEFIVRIQPSHGTPVVLHQRYLNPAENPSDRGLQQCDIPLPRLQTGDCLVLITHPGPGYNMAYDWSYWSRPTLGLNTTEPTSR